MIILATWVSLGMCGVTTQAAATNGGLSFDTTGLASAIEQTMTERRIPGCVVGIVAGPDLAYVEAFGFADLESANHATTDTLFQIGSLTKPFTATLLCALRDDGLLRLDDHASSYLPPGAAVPSHPLGPGITLRHLATHTSGLGANPPNRRNRPNSPSVMLPYDIADLYAGLETTVLAAPPGQQFVYSNYGFGLLGHLLERAGSMPYGELLRRRLLTPIGMRNTFIRVPPDEKHRLASAYWPNDAPRMARPHWEFGEVCGFGGLVTDVPDLAKFVSFQLSDPHTAPAPLARTTVRETWTPQHLIGTRWRAAVGLGWWIMPDEQFGDLIIHGGEVDGHSADVGFSPQHGVGWIVLANVGADSAGAIANILKPIVLTPAAEQAARVGDLREREAWVELELVCGQILRRAPANGRLRHELGYAELMLGKNREAAANLGRAALLGYEAPSAFYNAACAYARAGDADGAFEALWKAVGAGFSNREAAAADPDLASLRRDARWERLFERE